MMTVGLRLVWRSDFQ